MEGLELWAGRINGTGTKKVDKKLKILLFCSMLFSQLILFSGLSLEKISLSSRKEERTVRSTKSV